MPLGPVTPGSGGYGDPADDYGNPGDSGGGVGSEPGFGAGLPIYDSLRAVLDAVDFGVQAWKMVANAFADKGQEWQHVADLMNAGIAKWVVARDAAATTIVRLETRLRVPVTGPRNDPESALKNFLAAIDAVMIIDDQTTAS